MVVSGQLHAPAPFTASSHWMRGWVGPRTGLDVVAKKENPCSCREWNPGRPASSSVTILTEIITTFIIIIGAGTLGRGYKSRDLHEIYELSASLQHCRLEMSPEMHSCIVYELVSIVFHS
jgi:hypothetical protein